MENLLKKGYSLEKIKEKTYSIIEDSIGISREEIYDNVKIVELGFDSLDAVQLIMELEKEFDIIISDEEAMKMETLNDVFYYLVPIKEWRRLKIKKINDSKDL